MRQCLFCTRKAESKEDAWPRWMTNQFKRSQLSEVRAELGGLKLKSWHLHQPELTARCVCRTCNNGWMSSLENQAKPVLQPLLMGKSCRIDAASQALVATWSLKTAMVLEALEPPDKRAYAQAERERLRSVTALPWRTTVWLAASAEGSWFMSAKHRLLGAAGAPSGMSTTMAFAHVALQVLTLRVPEHIAHVTTDVRRGPWEKSTVRVWSPQDSQAVWPPVMGLSGEIGLDAFAERFSPSAEVPMDTVAV